MNEYDRLIEADRVRLREFSIDDDGEKDEDTAVTVVEDGLEVAMVDAGKQRGEEGIGTSIGLAKGLGR